MSISAAEEIIITRSPAETRALAARLPLAEGGKHTKDAGHHEKENPNACVLPFQICVRTVSYRCRDLLHSRGPLGEPEDLSVMTECNQQGN